jgi:RNA polymerase sigma-B factor
MSTAAESVRTNPRSARERTAAMMPLFVEYRATGDRRVRNVLVEQHRDVADYFVKRYSRRGVAADDLRQLALIAIIHAVERFDPDVGVAFSTFASRTIEGELKRYFRDRTWSVRPPRRAQELHLELRRAEEDLTQQLGRSPTVAELAATLDASEDHVLEALEAGVAHQAASLDQSPGPDDDGATRGERVLAESDPGFYMRFFENMTQPEIAERIGVSQSYLSRILRKALVDLRSRLGE